VCGLAQRAHASHRQLGACDGALIKGKGGDTTLCSDTCSIEVAWPILDPSAPEAEEPEKPKPGDCAMSLGYPKHCTGAVSCPAIRSLLWEVPPVTAEISGSFFYDCTPKDSQVKKDCMYYGCVTAGLEIGIPDCSKCPGLKVDISICIGGGTFHCNDIKSADGYPDQMQHYKTFKRLKVKHYERMHKKMKKTGGIVKWQARSGSPYSLSYGFPTAQRGKLAQSPLCPMPSRLLSPLFPFTSGAIGTISLPSLSPFALFVCIDQWDRARITCDEGNQVVLAGRRLKSSEDVTALIDAPNCEETRTREASEALNLVGSTDHHVDENATLEQASDDENTHEDAHGRILHDHHHHRPHHHHPHHHHPHHPHHHTPHHHRPHHHRPVSREERREERREEHVSRAA
jgi:hypothetical protein